VSAHAILSPSGFKALMLCPAKPAMERGLPDKSSSHADEGTLAHEYAAQYLTDGEAVCYDQDMAPHIDTYVAIVRDFVGDDGTLFVEQAVPIGHITGEDGAEGTADAVILRGDELIVIDLKYGRGVEVTADQNPQLMLYALGALEKFDLVGDIRRVRLVIVQPRISSAPSEYDMTVDELQLWADTVAKLAAQAASYLHTVDDDAKLKYCSPHEEACRFCKAKPTCPALARTVEQALGAEFTDLTTDDKVEQEALVKAAVPSDPSLLGAKLDAVPLVEMWCKAIRAEAEKVLLAGGAVEGYKLVQGRRPARAWSDEQAVEVALKSMRLKKEQMYDFKVISPTSAEKLLGKQPKRWTKIQALIAQGEGKPSVAPMSDKRPAITIAAVADEFQPIAEGAGDLV